MMFFRICAYASNNSKTSGSDSWSVLMRHMNHQTTHPCLSVRIHDYINRQPPQPELRCSVRLKKAALQHRPVLRQEQILHLVQPHDAAQTVGIPCGCPGIQPDPNRLSLFHGEQLRVHLPVFHGEHIQLGFLPFEGAFQKLGFCSDQRIRIIRALRIR